MYGRAQFPHDLLLNLYISACYLQYEFKLLSSAEQMSDLRSV